MSHPEQTAFIELVARTNAEKVRGAKILEVGSYDVYGTFRSFFSQAGEYVGIDLSAGPGVDMVLSSHDLVGQLSGFDVVVSGEALEHDTDWRLSVRNMVEVLKPGGIVIITCAGTGRPEHGTTRTNPDESPGTQSLGWDHYENVSAGDFRAVVDAISGIDYLVWENPRVFDLYAVIVKSEQASGWELPTDGPKTLNGLALEQLESIPDANVSFAVEGYRFETEEINGTMIKKVAALSLRPKKEPDT